VHPSSNHGGLARPGAKPPGPKLKNGGAVGLKIKKGQKPRAEIKKGETRNVQKDFDGNKKCYSQMIEGREVEEFLRAPYAQGCVRIDPCESK